MNETKLHSDDIEKSNQKLLGMYYIIKTGKLMTCFRENWQFVIQLLLEERFKVYRLPIS